MSDESRRRQQRDAQAAAGGMTADRVGTPADEARRAGALSASLREGLPYPLDLYAGEAVYLDGIRMSWFGRLLGVSNVWGEAALLLHPLVRVGDFGAEGPQWQHCETWPTSEERPGVVFCRDVSAITATPPTWRLPT